MIYSLSIIQMSWLSQWSEWNIKLNQSINHEMNGLIEIESFIYLINLTIYNFIEIWIEWLWLSISMSMTMSMRWLWDELNHLLTIDRNRLTHDMVRLQVVLLSTL